MHRNRAFAIGCAAFMPHIRENRMRALGLAAPKKVARAANIRTD
jgi:hypothetical protein